MKAKYKDMVLEGTPDEILMFSVISKFEKKMQKEFEEQMKIAENADKKRGKLYNILSKRNEEN